MKRHIIFLSFIVLFFTACSNDGDKQDDFVFPEIKTSVHSANGLVKTGTFIYSGSSKVVKINYLTTNQNVTTEYSTTTFGYSDNLIIKAETVTNGVLSQGKKYSYDEQSRLREEILYKYTQTGTPSDARKTVFTYNSNGIVVVKVYNGNHTAQTVLGNTFNMKIENQNIVESAGSVLTYDDKNTPIKNMIGMRNLSIAEYEGGSNNILKRSQGSNNITYTYQYNTANYPTKATKTGGANGTETTTYTYK